MEVAPTTGRKFTINLMIWYWLEADATCTIFTADLMTPFFAYFNFESGVLLSSTLSIYGFCFHSVTEWKRWDGCSPIEHGKWFHRGGIPRHSIAFRAIKVDSESTLLIRYALKLGTHSSVKIDYFNHSFQIYWIEMENGKRIA